MLPYRIRCTFLTLTLVAWLAGPSMVAAQEQVDLAVLGLPEDMRAAATVMGYDDDGELVQLREGAGEMICVADQPGDDRYASVCYHESLDPFISRGRELRAEGVEGKDAYTTRHAEMDAGTLALPESGAALYNVNMKLEDFDPETASPALYSIYTPYATMSSTGLPEKPAAPGAPWLMRAGTASSHIMIVIPANPDH